MTERREAADLVVIGGGINGAGIAREAAMRGLSVLLLEKGDFCSGTSAWSSRLIHGGLRYLEYFELPLVYESLNERRILQRIAGHLVRPIRISIPIYAGARRGRGLIRLGLTAYDLLSFRKVLPNHDMLNRDETLAEESGLNPDGLRGMGRYFDAQVSFAERLVLENVLDAEGHGATVANYSPVTGILDGGGQVRGVAYRDGPDGPERRLEARAVVNAAGPWVDAVLATAAQPANDLIGGTKGSHIVVSRFDGCPADAIYVEAKSDGRPFFIIPWNGLVLIGTTDIRYDGSLDSVRASAKEVDYLLEECNRVFPGARLAPDDVHYAYAGVRPLPRRESGPESAITRRHIIHNHRDSVSGLYSIIGGKLTTYRNLAKQTVDSVVRDLGIDVPPSRSDEFPLPGMHSLEDAEAALKARGWLSDDGVQRVLGIYGGRALDIVADVDADRLPAGALDDAGRVLAAEAGFALRSERAVTLADLVHRRLMLGFDADQGRPLYGALADEAARVEQWTPERRQAELDELNAYSASFRIAG